MILQSSVYSSETALASPLLKAVMNFALASSISFLRSKNSFNYYVVTEDASKFSYLPLYVVSLLFEGHALCGLICRRSQLTRGVSYRNVQFVAKQACDNICVASRLHYSHCAVTSAV